jgi:AcrR family transcriptional regulator
MRQSAAEIDHAILDVAAAIFATHGFAHASLQQIADAVGYSKPGLLHRFGSKEALHQAVLAEVDATAHDLTDCALGQRDPTGRVAAVLELLVRKALARPGMVQLMLADLGPTSAEPTRAAGHRLLDALGQRPGGPAARLRVVLALQLVVAGASTQHSPADGLQVDEAELVPLLVRLATGVIGAPLN